MSPLEYGLVIVVDNVLDWSAVAMASARSPMSSASCWHWGDTATPISRVLEG